MVSDTTATLDSLTLPAPVPQAQAKAPRPVVATAEFLTRTRDDLFTLSRRLMSSISPLALQDASKPVIVTVRGSNGRGKKIFPDAAREHMLGHASDFEGRLEDYELWRGVYNNKDFEIDFYNYMLSTAFNKHRAELNGDPKAKIGAKLARKAFLSLRQHGGITFLHNDQQTAAYDADIDILLEAKNFSPYDEPSTSELTPAFNILTLSYPYWARLITIEIKNEELMQHAPFAREIASMQPPSEKISDRFLTAAKMMKIIPPATTALLAHGNVPIYGVNIARPD